MRLLLMLQFVGLAACSEIINVGTVLWRKSDGVKQCWSASEKDLLVARRIMQGLLPEPELVDFTANHAMSTLLEYFRMCFDVIKEGSTGETQEHLLRSLADAVGGYLNRIALPIARQLYYSGRITYEESNTIHQLYEDLKRFLKTSGQGWRFAEESDHVQIAAAGLETNFDADRAACENLIFEESSNLRMVPQNESVFLERSGGNGSYVSSNQSPPSMDLEPQKLKYSLGQLSLPMLDNAEKPTALALPLKEDPLVSLTSKESAHLIPKFYIYAVKCISARSESKEDVDKFNSAFFGWLIQDVLPHLDDDVWYIGFESVLRVVQSVRASGIDTNVIETPKKATRFLFENGVELGGTMTKKSISWLKNHLGVLGNHNGIEIFVLVFLVFTLILGAIFWRCVKKTQSSSSFISDFGERVSSAVTSFGSSRKAEKINSEMHSRKTTSFNTSGVRSVTTSPNDSNLTNSRQRFYKVLPCSPTIDSHFASRKLTTTQSYPTLNCSSHSTSSTDGDLQDTESTGTSDSNSESPPNYGNGR